MNIKKNKELEIKIVELTESLIHKTLSSCNKDHGLKNEALTQAETIAFKLVKTVHLLIGKEEHLESMLSQLVLQRIPDELIVENFDAFLKNLEMLITKATSSYRAQIKDLDKISSDEKINSCKTRFPKGGNIKASHNDKLLLALNLTFPKEKVYKNYCLKGISLQYYIPGKKLILSTSESAKKNELKKYGFKIIDIDDSIRNPFRLKAIIKHKLRLN